MVAITSGSVSSRYSNKEKQNHLPNQHQHIQSPVQERKNSKYDSKGHNNEHMTTMKKNCYGILVALGVVLTLLVLLQSSSSSGSGVGDSASGGATDRVVGRKLSTASSSDNVNTKREPIEKTSNGRKLNVNNGNNNEGATRAPTEAPTKFEAYQTKKDDDDDA